MAFGDKYLGGQLPGANPMTNQYTGEYYKEEDVSTKYQMPDALKSNIQNFVEQANKTAGLPAGLMSAVAKKESSWNPLAINKESGAPGLFQFMPETAKAYGLEGNDVFDPNKAAVAAATYFRDNMNRYGGDIAARAISFSLVPLFFVPLSNAGWTQENPNKIVLYGPDGGILKTIDGKASIDVSEDSIVLAVGSNTLKLSGDGLQHNGVDIGSTHTHDVKNVESGGSTKTSETPN